MVDGSYRQKSFCVLYARKKEGTISNRLQLFTSKRFKGTTKSGFDVQTCIKANGQVD